MAADIQIKKRFTRRRLIVILILSVAVIAAGWLFYLGLSLTVVGGELGLKPPLWLKESRYMEVVRDIEAGSLAPAKPATGVFSLVDYAEFVVALPPSHQSLTPHGIVFAEKRSDGRLFVVFPTWHGFHHDMMGYLYCSQPLSAEDYQLNTGWGVEAVLVCGQALKVTHLRGPWYSIDRGLD
jgi:hypothetical protein